MQTFIEDTFQNRHNAIMKSSEWLSRQLDDIRAKMETSSKALAEFQGSIGVADMDGDKSTYTEHMGELSRQYTQAEVGEDSTPGPAQERAAAIRIHFLRFATIRWCSS